MARASSRDQIVRTAHDLFYSEGFHSVGLDRILDQVGVTKTTFYNHFASKDDLVLATLDMHDKWWRETFARRLRELGGDTPRGQLLAIFDFLDEIFGGEEFNGCIFINVSVEFPLCHDPAHVAAVRHKQAMEDLIAELAGYASAEDPRQFAREVSIVLEGAYVTQQVSQNMTATETGARVLRMLIDEHIPTG
jgi:AcrR family transcriptional regulator